MTQRKIDFERDGRVVSHSSGSHVASETAGHVTLYAVGRPSHIEFPASELGDVLRCLGFLAADLETGSAVLTFDVAEWPHVFRTALVASRLATALDKIAESTRMQLKHGDNSKETQEALERVREEIPWEALSFINGE